MTDYSRSDMREQFPTLPETSADDLPAGWSFDDLVEQPEPPANERYWSV